MTTEHWWIQAWADRAAVPSLTKSRGWSWLREAVCLGHGGELYWKQYVMLLSIMNVHITVSPLGAPPRTPVTGSHSALAMVRPLWQILDPPLLQRITARLLDKKA